MAGLLFVLLTPEKRRPYRVSWGEGPYVSHGSPGDAKHRPGPAPTRLFNMRISRYLYESGSGESDGFANSFFSSELIGTLRFSPFGGIFCMNHLS